jgi:hypothetical protein
MLRKHLLPKAPVAPTRWPDEKDIAAITTVLITSEISDYPIENVFDHRRGPGGSRWIGAESGEQTLILPLIRRRRLAKFVWRLKSGR